MSNALLPPGHAAQTVTVGTASALPALFAPSPDASRRFVEFFSVYLDG